MATKMNTKRLTSTKETTSKGRTNANGAKAANELAKRLNNKKNGSK